MARGISTGKAPETFRTLALGRCARVAQNSAFNYLLMGAFESEDVPFVDDDSEEEVDFDEALLSDLPDSPELDFRA